MYDPFRVGKLECLTYLAYNFKRMISINFIAADQAVEISSIDELHHKVEMTFRCLTEVINADDSGVIKFGKGARLSLKSSEKLYIICKFARKQFNSHEAIKTLLPPLIDGSHPAAAD